ncbi:isoleucine--tRNA ligase [Candidatus Mycoplasma haematominutum]|uniref:Isoleucine--tRNA ligase n=1 Tax=Candidatus Mycoplasma haematominutum 'Birmingham 1' TaxID=1116213 RepID=G8C2V4_9MOLU|nr:isoleucine--tRNA ligase [Candidatus Mycoplasma haematominutum]CCE66652.1 isoleucyl-tRNA synthetase [Candidatus Mycoplasma haematominutum 'Birmingham 1']
MVKFKDTLFLPKTDFPMKANLVAKQERFWTFWRENSIYHKRLSLNEGKPKYRLLDGPPYANGAIHMGHAFNKILKDFVVRWKNISGYQCSFIPGWDVHGLPIENKVEKDVRGFKTLPESEKLRVAHEFALSQVELQTNQLSQLNLCFSLDKKYLTSDRKFIENEYSLFTELWSAGLIYRELKPVAWSYSSETALAESELIYREVECESIYFCWEIVDSPNTQLKGVKLIIWTTTPYSLEANLAVAFNPKLSYSTFKYQHQTYLASEEFISKASSLFNCADYLITSEDKVAAAELENSRYLNNLTGEINPIFSASFLEGGVGSGLVHLAPGLGEEDYLICREHQLSPYCVINEKGYFQEEAKFSPISGKFYQEASKTVIEFLEASKNLILVQTIKHKNATDWRTGTPTFYRATQQWFLNLEALREKLANSLKKGNWISQPSWLADKLGETILSRKEWCLSRQRSWGVPIPVIFKDGEIYGGLKQLKKNISILVERGIEAWHILPIETFLGETLTQEELSYFSKCTDILDVWFDSGTAFMQMGDFQSALYVEGCDQLRGWFNSSTILSVFQRGKLPFQRLVAHGFILDEKGYKMSKSQGNVVDPLQIVSKVGSDIFRLWVASSNFYKDIRFSWNQLSSIEQQYRKFRNVLFKFSLSVLPNFDWSAVKISALKPKQLGNQYILHFFVNTLSEAHRKCECLDFQKIIKLFSEFVELYSAWYLELAKPILYSRENENNLKSEIIDTIAAIFKYSLQLLSIFIPQTAEEVYSHLNFPSKKESLWLEDYKIEEIRNLVPVDEAAWNHFFKVRTDILIQLEEKYSSKELTSIREARIHIPSEELKYFDTDTWAHLLGAAEVAKTSEKKIQIFKTQLQKCPRCLLYSQDNECTELNWEGDPVLLCNSCSIVLRNYWNNACNKNICQDN